MLERIWIHIQTYTIIALVNSPALLMLWTGFEPIVIIDHGPQSTAIQEAPIEIYSVQINPEEISPTEESQKEEQKIVEEKVTKKTVVAKRNKKRKETIKSNKKKEVVPKTVSSSTIEISQEISFPPKKNVKQTRKKRKKRVSRCTLQSNRRIQKISKQQFALQKKVVDRYLGNIDNIKGLAKAYWYSGKKGEGILLKSIPCKSPLRNMGIRPNDIIISINGKQLKNNLTLVGRYFELRSKKDVEITLKRQNRPLTLQYEIVKKLKKG